MMLEMQVGFTGLKIVAVAVVAHAIIGMAKNLTPDLKRKAIALFALVGTLLMAICSHSSKHYFSSCINRLSSI